MGMYRINQIKVELDHTEDDIRKIIDKQYGCFEEDAKIRIIKKSVDARKKDAIKIVYTVDIESPKFDYKRVSKLTYIDKKAVYRLKGYIAPLTKRPVVIGAGPAGLFAALLLAERGMNPILIERGQSVEKRIEDVNKYFETGELDVTSNIQFGEGGAGTFSDGKINTGVKDKYNRITKIISTFIEAGAPEEIRYLNKPHIGTDYLVEVVKNIRNKIIKFGGEVRFNTTMTELIIDESRITGVKLDDGSEILTDHVVLAIGHSARDTFENIVKQNIPVEAKAFAIGLRIEHPQDMISKQQYGEAYKHEALPIADYKLTYRTAEGRSVYTFCMCPGGVVVNSASETGGVVCNGMSNFVRDEKNANSAILVNVHPTDFDGSDVLAGVRFQRRWEEEAFKVAGSDYSLPVQRLDDFINGEVSTEFGDVKPSIKGKTTMADLNKVLPSYVTESIKEGMVAFGRKIKGFDRDDAILIGVETRSSSPIRILRNKEYMSSVVGLYPCGEGAGYAGGIMSAALDGIKVAEAILTV